jgi:hypothetical protein
MMHATPADKKYLPLMAVLFLVCIQIKAQPITGIWKGKMGNSRVELKLIRKGDSLIGTSYYYDSKSNFSRYSVKGYFDDQNNDVIWWDDILLEGKRSNHFTGTVQQPLLAVADFNCPGEGIMKLDGKSSRKEDEQKEKKELHLVKGNNTAIFPDEWDFLIENYAYGVAHPEIVDSIEQYAFHAEPDPTETATVISGRPGNSLADNPIAKEVPRKADPLAELPVVVEPTANPRQSNTEPEKRDLVKQEPQIHAPSFIPASEQTNEERFTSRKKILQQVIPVKGDSIELKFYDNAEIDGDSIAVFLNGHLLREHILLAEQAYIMKIALTDLQADNELVMVAENLGSIPPNTSLMVAVVEDKRYEAHLQSTEGSSALVRLVKP